MNNNNMTKNVNRFNMNNENDINSHSSKHFDGTATVNIKIKSLNSKSIIGSFCSDDTLGDVFSFIHSNHDVLDLPSSFGLRTNYPRRIYNKSESNKSLRSLGISSNVVLIITELPNNSSFNALFSNESIQLIKNSIGNFFRSAFSSKDENINIDPKKNDDPVKYYNGNSTEYQ